MRAYLNIGSNQGDRHAHIEQAIALIVTAYPDAKVVRSNYIESEPWGYESANRFLNIGIALDMAQDIDPIVMLHTLQGIEKAVSAGAHRNADGTYRDRDIDIDIIEIEGIEMESDELTLPHPRAHERDFVIIPMRELKQSFVLTAGRSVTELGDESAME